MWNLAYGMWHVAYGMWHMSKMIQQVIDQVKCQWTYMHTHTVYFNGGGQNKSFYVYFICRLILVVHPQKYRGKQRETETFLMYLKGIKPTVYCRV